MQQIGCVLNTDENRAVVQIRRQVSCGENCAMCKSCGEADRTLTVINDAGAAVGQNVKLELATGKVLFLAFITYIMPLILFGVASIFVKSAWILALVLILGFVVCSLFSNQIAKKDAFQSRIIQIIGTQNSGE